MKRDKGTSSDERRRPAYPSLLDLALRTGRWTLAAGGVAAVIATGGAGCMGAAPADYEPVTDPGGTIADLVVDADSAIAPDEGADVPVPFETAGIAPDLVLDPDEATTVPDAPDAPVVPDAVDEATPDAVDDTTVFPELAGVVDYVPAAEDVPAEGDAPAAG